jgi:VanZ family protein
MPMSLEVLPQVALGAADFSPTERTTRIFGLPRGGLSANAARRCGLTLLGLYVALLFTSTHWPRLRLLDTPTMIPVDKIAHFSCYGGLTALALLLPIGFLLRPDGRTVKRRWAAALGLWSLVALLGLIDETTQPWFDRDFEWADLACDTAGALLAILVVSALWNWRFGKRPAQASTVQA